MAVMQSEVCFNEQNWPKLFPLHTFWDAKTNIDDEDDVVNLMNECFHLNKKVEEYVYMIALNAHSDILGIFEVSHGAMDYTIANTREIFMRALLCGASRIIVVHNHPTGNTTISKADIDFTEKLLAVGELLNIEVLDHIIICRDKHVSVLE